MIPPDDDLFGGAPAEDPADVPPSAPQPAPAPAPRASNPESASSDKASKTSRKKTPAKGASAKSAVATEDAEPDEPAAPPPPAPIKKAPAPIVAETPAASSTAPSAKPAPEYQVLARKWRPKTFADLVGQEDIAQQLRAMIQQGRIGQAFLFCGPRGVGKTSSARLLACALNAPNGPSADFDPNDPVCREIQTGSDLDVIEIDGASNNSVENIRDLRNKVGISPLRDRYKVYIIDEVHMLSGSAFNALLKTLEEPPPHVKFILATTERHKIPDTILSRCQTFDFNRLDLEAIVARLDYILKNEPSIAVDEKERRDILEQIALSSDGGLRDAQMTLDQLVALGQGKLTLDNTLRLLGLVQTGMLEDVVEAILQRKTQYLLSVVGDLARRGRDLERFLKSLMGFVRDLMLLQGGAPPELTSLRGERYDQARARFSNAPLEALLNIMQALMELEPKLKSTVPARFLLEFAFIKLTALQPVEGLAKLVGRLEALEKKG